MSTQNPKRAKPQPADKATETATEPVVRAVPTVPATRPVRPLPAKTRPTRAENPVPPPVPNGRLRRRHFGLALSLVILVLGPVGVSAWYLYTRATDQFASTVGFSVRTEEMSSAVELLGGITNLSGSSSSDTDILYEFIQSQKLVADIDARLGLRGIWSWPDNDPVFTYHAPGSIEDLLRHWKRMVRVSYDSATSLIEVRVLAFRPEDATRIAQTILDESSAMINNLTAVAREDAIRYARQDLDEAVERLKHARQAITTFRNRHQIVDPAADIQIQVGLLATLQSQLAEALIEQGLLTETTRQNDPRIAQSARRIKIIKSQIEAERGKLGLGSNTLDGEAFAAVVGEYERLTVDRQFAEQTYTAALANFDSALAEARRQSRYLAAYILPTRSEAPQYPQREILLGMLTMFMFMFWGILALIFYSLRDRR